MVLDRIAGEEHHDLWQGWEDDEVISVAEVRAAATAKEGTQSA